MFQLEAYRLILTVNYNRLPPPHIDPYHLHNNDKPTHPHHKQKKQHESKPADTPLVRAESEKRRSLF